MDTVRLKRVGKWSWIFSSAAGSRAEYILPKGYEYRHREGIFHSKTNTYCPIHTNQCSSCPLIIDELGNLRELLFLNK